MRDAARLRRRTIERSASLEEHPALRPRGRDYTEHSGSVLRIQLNRPTKRNVITSSMYVTLASDGECYEALAGEPANCQACRLT
jgi:hypothetical protein